VFTGIEPGSSLGKYTIERELGRGGMGVVYLALDNTLSRRVALKHLYQSLSNDSVFIERFRMEARVVASVLHPNVVRINSLETLDCGLFIDMEYVDGPSLGAALQHQVFTPQLAVQIARDVLDGLLVCHDLGVIHRDIKPNNILLSPEGKAKLADFGLATAYASHLESSIFRTSTSGFFMGTPRFAPPEAWEGKQPQPNWDFYSLGLVLYECLYGRPLYDGATPLAIVKQVVSQQVVPTREIAPFVSEELGSLIDRFISHDCDKRPQDVREAILALRQVPEYSSTSGADSPTVRVAVKSVKRKAHNAKRIGLGRRIVGRLLAGGVVALVAALATWYSVRNSAVPFEVDAPVPTSEQRVLTDVLHSSSLTKDEILLLPRTDASRQFSVMNAKFFEPGGPREPGVDIAAPTLDRAELWLIIPDSASAWTVMGVSDRFVSVSNLTEISSGVLTLSGNWASFVYPTGSLYQEGTLTGTGTWLTRAESLNLSLKFDNARDRSVEVFTVTAVSDVIRATDTRYFHELERKPLVHALIYCALLPREREWVYVLEQMLPSLPDSRIIAPLLEQAELPAWDGQANEAIWKDSYFDANGRIGELPGRPRAIGGVLKARVVSGYLVMNVTARYNPERAWGGRCVIMPISTSPLIQEPRMDVTINDTSSLESHLYVGGREIPWDCNWQVALDKRDGSVSVEIGIPISDVNPAAYPSRTAAWRANLAIFEYADDGSEVPIVSWGFPELSAAEHGLLLRFDEQEN